MKRFLTILLSIFFTFSVAAQAEKSIIIDQNTFRPVQKDALTGVNIDPIGLDDSKRPCARLKVKINRMTREEINAIEVKIITNNQLTKNKTAEYDNGLIIEMTAKPQTRFYFHHDEFGDSNEVCLNLEADKEYYLEAYLNQSYSIVVNSNVAGAAVYIDNKYCGETSQNQSLTIKDVMVGSHTLQLEYGSMKYTQQIEVNSGSIFFRQNVNTQASKPQFVVFAVEPQNAVVTIENNHYPLQDGAMQTVLNNGSYNYTVSAVGYHPQSGVFTVSGAKVEKVINLTADSAKVTLTAPDNAEIWVNNEKKGVSTWSGTLTSGTYIFEARKEGHRTATLSAQITSNPAQQSYTLPAPEPIVGTVVVTSTPIMADVQLDGKPVGRTPLELNNILVGKHTLTISKEGYETKKQTLSLIENKTETINIALAKTSSAAKVQTVQRGSITSAPYKVGDYYNDGKKEGVVFEVSADGISGKIVSMVQSEKPLEWCSDDSEPGLRMGADSPADGAYNMSKVKAVENWQTKFPAFAWCANLGEGWYLPAIGELHKLIVDKTVYEAVNQTLKATNSQKLYKHDEQSYWSSTNCWGKYTFFVKPQSYKGAYIIGEYIPDQYSYSHVESQGLKYTIRAVAAFKDDSIATIMYSLELSKSEQSKESEQKESVDKLLIEYIRKHGGSISFTSNGTAISKDGYTNFRIMAVSDNMISVAVSGRTGNGVSFTNAPLAIELKDGYTNIQSSVLKSARYISFGFYYRLSSPKTIDISIDYQTASYAKYRVSETIYL